MPGPSFSCPERAAVVLAAELLRTYGFSERWIAQKLVISALL